jgi:hypothetical protein
MCLPERQTKPTELCAMQYGLLLIARCRKRENCRRLNGCALYKTNTIAEIVTINGCDCLSVCLSV